MRTTALAALALLAPLLVTGCSTSSITCDDVDDLTSQLAAADPDDGDYYDIQDKLNQATADCNGA